MRKIAIALCAVMLVATALFAGCAQSVPSENPGATATPQYTQVPAESTPAPGEITPTPAPASKPVPAGSSEADVASANEDGQPDQYNSTNQATTMAPDSADLGSPIP